MKNKLFILSFLIAAVLSVIPGSAFAAVNNDPADCRTLSVQNHTRAALPVTSCWPSNSASASSGDIVNFLIYYHNTGPSTENLSVRFSPNPTTTISGTATFTGEVLASGSSVSRGTATLTVPSSSRLTFQGVRISVDQPGPYHGARDMGPSSSTSIFSTTGLSIGSVTPGWESQGTVRLSFSVSSDSTPTPDPSVSTAPTVNTQNPSALNSSEGYVTLNGDFASNGADTTTWFNYYTNGTCSGTGTTVNTVNRGMTSGNFSYYLSSLTSGTYSYKAFARNGAGEVAAVQCKTFTISRAYGPGPVEPTGNVPTVTTYNPNSIDNTNGRATLNGFYNANGLDTQTCFEIYGTDYSSRTINCVNRGTGSGNVSHDLTGLPTGTYYYRITGINSAITTEVKGEWKQFTINRNNDYYPPTPSYNNPTATTLAPLSVSSTDTNLDGYYNANGCSAYSYYEYGPNQSFGYRTAEISRGSGNGSASQYISGLSSNTTYYYRLIVRNCNGTANGGTRFFTTTGLNINDNSTIYTNNTVNTTRTNTTRTVLVNNGTGNGGKFIKLSIDNTRTMISRNDQVTYEVTWENISSVVLHNLVLEVSFPKELRIVDASRGDVDRSANAVYLNIERLDPQEEGRMIVITRMQTALRDHDPVVARAIMAFENPTLQGAQENAIAYDADTYSDISSGNLFGASIFGLGFLPGTLAGWLIIFLIILLIILAARYYVRNGRGTDGSNNPPVPPANMPGGYTPYRPQA